MSEKKRFRIRDIFIKYPALDRLRIDSIAAFFKHGINWESDSFNVVGFVSPKAKDFVKTLQARPDIEIPSAKPCIYAYYHGHMHVLLGLAPRRIMTVLASMSRDGEMIAKAATSLGFGMIRGSKTHGGMKAGLEMMTAGQDGQCILFNVDGPRGPLHEVKESVIRVAELSGLPIVPALAFPRTEFPMNTWDRYSVPMNGTPMIYIIGDPLYVGQDLSKEEREVYRKQLNDYMALLNDQGCSFWN